MRACLVRCLLAGMLGDAWGGRYEGGAGEEDAPFPAFPAISDDTQLVLATAEAIQAEQGRVAPVEIAGAFRRWYESGRLRGVGSSTLKALRDLSAGAHWALSGARGEYAAGSGAAMRAAPLAFFLDPSSAPDRQLIRDVARITHHSDEAYAGALAVILAIRIASEAKSVPPNLAALVAQDLPDTALRDRLLHLAEAPPARLLSSGHVVEAVPTALFLASRHTTSVLDVIRGAIRLGGDTDTIAAIAAQVVAAGGAAVPEKLVHRISGWEEAQETFGKLSTWVPG